MRESVVFYRSFYEAIRRLPAEQFKASALAILEYGLDGKEPETDGIERTVFCMAKPQIDANNRRYENGTKGGRPKTKTNLTETKDNRDETKVEPKEKVKENVKEKENTYSCAFEALWSAYPRKKEKANAYKCYKARLADGFSEDELMTAVKRYADECKARRTEARYQEKMLEAAKRIKLFEDSDIEDFSQNKLIWKDKINISCHELIEKGNRILNYRLNLLPPEVALAINYLINESSMLSKLSMEIGILDRLGLLTEEYTLYDILPIDINAQEDEKHDITRDINDICLLIKWVNEEYNYIIAESNGKYEKDIYQINFD